MANRNYVSGGKIFSMHVSPVFLDCTVQIGAAGAVSSFTGSTIKSVVLVSTGIYKINLMDNFSGLYAAMGSMQSPASGLSGVSTVEVQNAPNASVSVLATPSLTVKCLAPAGTVVAPASGSALNVLIFLSNSSIKIQGE